MKSSTAALAKRPTMKARIMLGSMMAVADAAAARGVMCGRRAAAAWSAARQREKERSAESVASAASLLGMHGMRVVRSEGVSAGTARRSLSTATPYGAGRSDQR
jgi:hypothetical protein